MKKIGSGPLVRYPRSPSSYLRLNKLNQATGLLIL